MIRKVCGVVVVMVMVAAGVAHADEGSVKIGSIDLSRALNEVPEGKRAKAQLESEGKSKQQRLELKQKELQSMRQEYEKQRLVLPGDALQKKEQAMQQKIMELQQMGAQFEKEFAEKEASLTKPIGDKIRQVIAQIGKDGSYALILPKEMVLYVSSGDDVTDEVIRRYK